MDKVIEYKYIRYQGKVYLKVDNILTEDIEDVLYAPDVDITNEGKEKQITKSRTRISKIISGK